MPLSDARWKTVSVSPHPWERDALDFIRQRLPDQEPYRAWANFHFVADNATINEVDLLVLTPGGLFLIEIKSWPGTVSGDAGTWVVSDPQRERRIDNPLILANSKAKRLKSILERQPALRRFRVPFIEPLVFLSHDDITIQLTGRARYGVCRRDRPERGSPAPRGIVSAITKRDFDGADASRGLADWHLAKAIANGLDQAGIRPSQSWREAGDYELQTLLGESSDEAYQDWIATHRATPSSRRRVRVYNVAQTADNETRESRERAARREYLLLEKVSHPGILGVEGLTHNELGPAVVYRYDPDAIRLDHYLAAHGASLNAAARLAILRQIAEALKYAHERHIIHRSLSPQSILVSNPESDAPTIQIFNWQLGFQDAGTSGSYASRLSPTVHPDELVDNTALVFMAPESVGSIEALGPHVDIFSLGSLAYFIFAGVPPAASVLERNELLREGRGLQLSSVLNAAHPKLQDLVQFSTHPEVLNRIESVEQFLDFLGDAEQAMLTHDDEAVPNPLDARSGDRLEHGFNLVKRLGSGSTAVALLVAREGGEEEVLKLAHKPELSDRVREEFATLLKLRHQHIVAANKLYDFGGLAGFTMERAGTTTLSQRLREDGPLHLELLERFGADLLDIVVYLESTGIPHRDLKPDNIGIRPSRSNRMLHLALFDFSLSTAPAESIGAGTRPYVDPFLSLRKPVRWDLHAERYSAAMTLYEMATGTHPQWGDGRSNPEVLDCEATLAVELFDPNLRDAMAAFFGRAFRRIASARFDNAEDMLRAWRQLFTAASRPAVSTTTDDEPVDIGAAVASVGLDANIVELGLSTRAANALDRMNVTTVRQLAGVASNRFLNMRGVGTKTRRELSTVVNALRERFPAVATTATVTNAEPAPAPSDRNAATLSVDELMQAVAAVEPAGKSPARVLHAFLGADPAPGAPDWPSQIDVAAALDLTRARVGQIVSGLRQKALKSEPISRLRDTIAEIIDANGGVVTVHELVDAVLAARGSAEDEPNRTRFATVVTRTAIETERASETPRFVDRRTPNVVLVGRDPAVTSYVARLGQKADELAALDPIAAPARVLDELRAVGTGLKTTMTDTRLVRLAVAASATASLSSRREVYPRGMAAERALRLAHGALSGIEPLTIEEVRSRVAGRYPEAEIVPGRPALDALLATEELGLVWDEAAAGGAGAYVLPESVSTSGLTSSSTVHTRYATWHAGAAAATISPDIADARIFEEKLRRTASAGGFLALMASPRSLVRAEREIGRRFPVARRSLDAMLIAAMRAEAEKAGVEWSVVERADASDRDSRDWANLLKLVDRALAAIDRQLATVDEKLMIVYPGLLARYDRVGFVDRLRDRASGPQSIWLLMASDGQAAMPVLDGVAVPMIGPGQFAEVPEAWIRNAHRADIGVDTKGTEGVGP